MKEFFGELRRRIFFYGFVIFYLLVQFFVYIFMLPVRLALFLYKVTKKGFLLFLSLFSKKVKEKLIAEKEGKKRRAEQERREIEEFCNS